MVLLILVFVVIALLLRQILRINEREQKEKKEKELEQKRTLTPKLIRKIDHRSTAILFGVVVLIGGGLVLAFAALKIKLDLNLSAEHEAAIGMLVAFGIPLAIYLASKRFFERLANSSFELFLPSKLSNLVKSAKTGAAQDIFKLAEYYERPDDLKYQDVDKSVGLLIEAANRRHVEANLKLVRMLLDGRRVPIDRDAAIERLRASVRLGSSDAAFLLSQYLKTERESGELLRQAADGGSPEARFLRETQIPQGERDAAQAIESFKFASKRMVPVATTCLADAYERGVGVKRDVAKAVKLYEKAAEYGDPEGMFQLALRFFYGIELERDRDEAQKWLRRAARMGLKRAELFAKANHIDLNAPVKPRELRHD